MLTETEVKELNQLCKENRQNIVKMVYNAASGHIGGSLSSVELLTVLFHKCMKAIPQWHRSPEFDLHIQKVPLLTWYIRGDPFPDTPR